MRQISTSNNFLTTRLFSVILMMSTLTGLKINPERTPVGLDTLTVTLPGDMVVNADSQNCGTIVNYTIPNQDDQGNPLSATQLSGLPSGSVFPLGSTANSFRIVADQGVTATYDFEGLTVGQPINGQDNWQVVKTGTGTGASINMAVVKSHAGNGGYSGSTGLEVEPLGGNNQLRISRVNDANFSLPVAEDNDVIEVIFDQNRNYWGAYLAFGFDANGNGRIGDSEITFAILDRDLDNLTRVYGPGLTTLASDTKPNFGWTQWRVTIDLTGNNGSGSISVAYRDLVNNGAFIEPAAYQNLNPGFDLSASDHTNPTSINGMLYRHGAGGASQLDNINYTVKEGLVHDFSIAVEDNTPPTAIAQNVVAELDQNGEASITAVDVDNGSYDACGTVSLSLDTNSFDCSNLGDNTVILTVTDENGNESTASSIVTVVDNIDPVSALTSDMIVSTDPDQCNALVTYNEPNKTDNCQTFTTTQLSGLPSGSVFPLGTTANSFRIVADQGATATYDFEGLTVGQPINGQDNWQVVKTGTGTGANINMAVVKSHAGNGGYSGSTGLEVEPLGGNNQLRISRVNDANFSLPVAEDDDVIEVIFDQNRNYWGAYLAFGFDTNGNGRIGDSEITFAILDRDLDNLTRVYGPGLATLASDTKPNFGWTQWRVTIDLTGNNGSGSISVAYRDLVNNGAFIEPAAYQNLNPGFDLSASDHTNPTNIDGMLYRHGAGGASQLDNINYTVKDGLVHDFSVTVNDIEAPSISLIGGAIVTIDYGSVYTEEGATSTDNCSSTVTIGGDVVDTNQLGTYAVTYQATDDSGNTSTMLTRTVHVVDNVPPVISATDLVVDNDAGTCGALISSFGASATDNAGAVSLSFDMAEGTVFGVGSTTVVATATDASGNEAQASFRVTVNDTESPSLAGMPSDITLVADVSTCSAVANWIAPSAIDNCSASIDSTHNPGEAFPVGSTTVTYTATDPSGNSISQSFTITVNPAHLSVTLTASGDAPDASIDAEVSGGCGPYTYSWSNGDTTEDLMNLAVGTYSLIVTDAYGATAMGSVTIEATCDLTASIKMFPRRPVYRYGEVHTIYLGYGRQTVLLKAKGRDGEPKYTFEWSDDPSIKRTWKKYAWVSPKETTTYEVTVTDQNGCIATETFTVNVIDIRCGDDKKRGKSKWSKRWKKPQKVQLCFKGKTICVSKHAVWSLLKRGAQLGSCEINPMTIVAKPESISEDVDDSLGELFNPKELDIQAYPNPSNGETTLSFRAIQDGTAQMTVVNTSGVMQANLFDEKVEKGQEVIVKYNTTSLKAGMYIVRVVSNGQAKSIKLMVKK